MTKRHNKTHGIAPKEFNALVDEGFTPTKKRRHKGGQKPLPPLTDSEYEALVKAGADSRLSRSAQAFHGAMCKILGTPPQPLSEESIAFLNSLDLVCRDIAAKHNIELRDDE